MKYFIITLLTCLSLNLIAQVKGNQQYSTTTIELDQFDEIEISLYAEVTVNASATTPSLTITIDDNLLSLVDMEVVGGRLHLNQKKWISPSDIVTIQIDAPGLKYIQQGTHEATIVNGINGTSFSAMANVGEIILNGTVDQFNANAEVGKIDATQLDAQTVDINLWSWGTISLGSPDRITGKASDAGKVIYKGGSPQLDIKTKNDAIVTSVAEELKSDYSEHKYIDIKIKNNSGKRVQAYVRGPKPDGGYFSYGFPIRAHQVKKERWTIGSKIYKTGRFGKRELVELTAADEGTTVMLF